MSKKPGKIHWMPVNGEIRVEETLLPPTRTEIMEYVGGDQEFVRVLFEGKQVYMLVNEIGAMIPLPVNEAATQVYHRNIRRQCESQGLPYHRVDYASIHGPAIVLQGFPK